MSMMMKEVGICQGWMWSRFVKKMINLRLALMLTELMIANLFINTGENKFH
jgi:hypothetical protein